MRRQAVPLAALFAVAALLLSMNVGCDDYLREAADFLDNASDTLDDWADDVNDHHHRRHDVDDWLDDVLDDIEDWFD
ncbi:MAG: hypothetical protein PVJ57_09575 [Phycisphaerae bacterium]|jgi:hypothetical protein